MIRTAASVRLGRVVSPLLLAAAVAVGATACSSGDDASGATQASGHSAEAGTQKALDAGLEAHAAGDLTTATERYREVLDLDPTNKFALYNLALIDEADSNYGLAEERYRKAIAADPAYEPALFNLAILVTSSDPEEAVSLYERAVAADRTDASAWMNLGLLRRDAGQKAAGDQAVARAIRLNPELTDPASKS